MNNLLLDALRAAIRHQAGEAQGTAALQAVDALAQAEAARREQVRAGHPPEIGRLPDGGWAYIGWSDQYCLSDDRYAAPAFSSSLATYGPPSPKAWWMTGIQLLMGSDCGHLASHVPHPTQRAARMS